MPLLLESSHGSDQVVARDGNNGLTAGELHARYTHLARILRELNIERLALHADNGLDWVVADMACQAASVCLVPLPTFFSESQLQHVLESVRPDALICKGSLQWDALLPGQVRARHEKITGGLELLLLEPGLQAVELPPGTGKITFTSGSTGKPKGVCLSNEQIVRQAQALRDAVGLERPRHLCLLPLSTLLENLAGVYTPLLAGGEIIVPPLAEIGFQGSSALDSRVFVQTISRYMPDSIILTPQLLLMLVAAAEAGWQPPETLKFAAVGGGRVSPGLVRRAHELGIPAFEGYGLSECASVVSLNTPGDHDHESSGRPLGHLDVHVENGEIVIGGNAMLGYLDEPESWGQDRIYSGDLGTISAEGFLRIGGRSKNLLISSFGRNINPEWVESEMLAHPMLSDCVVFGEGRPYCVALVSPRDPAANEETIRQFVEQTNARLPDYAQVKNWYRLPQPLAALDQLLTDNGRPRRQAIESRFQPAIESLYS
ncbi:MAG: AMP-binding protein [Xanthomonadales bacterium]|jgi:long-subunit acyl-CoA synthetase (AMP-forming)|nr:AMP-binding protein [Xanthomonadales bacterium]